MSRCTPSLSKVLPNKTQIHSIALKQVNVCKNSRDHHFKIQCLFLTLDITDKYHVNRKFSQLSYYVCYEPLFQLISVLATFIIQTKTILTVSSEIQSPLRTRIHGSIFLAYLDKHWRQQARTYELKQILQPSVSIFSTCLILFQGGTSEGDQFWMGLVQCSYKISIGTRAKILTKNHSYSHSFLDTFIRFVYVLTFYSVTFAS